MYIYIHISYIVYPYIIPLLTCTSRSCNGFSNLVDFQINTSVQTNETHWCDGNVQRLEVLLKQTVFMDVHQLYAYLELNTWYIDIYIYIVFVWGGWWQHGKLTSSYDLPAGNQSTRWGCLRLRFENVAPGMIKHIEAIESWQDFKVSLCKWCFCMSFTWFSTLNMFFFWIPNPSTGSEPQHVCFKRSKQHLLDFTTASRSPGTIQKATWS